MLALLVATSGFVAPHIDWHALAPEVVLTATVVLLLVVDLFVGPAQKWVLSTLAGLGLLGALVPVITLAVDGTSRSLFGGAFTVDKFALVMKGVFIITGYLTVLMSAHYVAEGDYWEGEYYLLLVSSVLGMTVMSSARDLISIFVALELLAIPIYLLAGWRKRDLRGNEASLKYYLMGVFASGVMLYGMSLIYGGTGSTLLADIGRQLHGDFGKSSAAAVGIVFTLIGFGFKTSAVPFHNWAPDAYEGAPTPITAYMSVASKAAGFVALLELIFVGFYGHSDIYGPLMWVLAALTMTVGNLIALRQTNVVRMLAYSSIAQAGFMLAPLAVAGHSVTAARESISAVVVYLIIYTAMNMGAFAVVIAVSRKTGSGDMDTWGGLGQYAPGLAACMSIFLFALAGIPPLGGWFAKFVIFRSALIGNTPGGTALGVVIALNSVIALFYYANLARQMWMVEPPDGDRTHVKVPAALVAAVGITVVATMAVGFLPQLAGRLGDAASSLVAFGR